MLNAKHRFHGYGSLRKVYGRSQSVRGPYISLRFADRNANRPYRVAVVVAKKVHKSAVKRNRMRRRIYEAIRKSNVPEGKDLIFTVYSEKILETPPLELQTMISDLLNKLSQTN